MTAIEISNPARKFLIDLLEQQETVEGVYITVDKPGTQWAKTLLSYCREELDSARKIQFDELTAFVDTDTESYLEGTVIDLDEGELTVRSPKSKTPILPENATIEDRVNYVLAMAVNPMLAAHGGMTTLVEVTSDGVAVLEFGGGCQGCAAVPLTMKFGVEKELLAAFPGEITGVRDDTDHSNTDNAYYKEGEA